MKKIRDAGIVQKLVAINALLMILVLSVVTVFIFMHERKQYLSELQKTGMLIAESLANNSALPILTRNFDLMENMMQPVLNFENVDHIASYDKNKNLLSWFGEGSGGAEKELVQVFSKDKAIQLIDDANGLLETIVPVYMERIAGSGDSLGLAEDVLFAEEGKGEVLGYVHMAMSTSGLNQRVIAFAFRLVFVVFVIAFLGIVLIAVVIRRFAAPIVDLSVQAKRIAQGEFGLRVNVDSRDEIGVLGDAFNEMVESLSDTINEVKERAAEVENLLEGARDGIFIMDKTFEIVKVNKDFAATLGYEVDGLLGRSFFSLIDESLSGPLALRIGPADRSVIREIDVHKLSGENVSFEINFMPIESSAEKGWLCFARNISERKMMEVQLVKSEKLAATGRLAADIAHEVNNPLGIIKNYITILKKEMEIGMDKEEITHNIDVVGDEIDRIADIIRGLLLFARPEPEGKNETDLNIVIRQVVKLTEGPLRKKNIHLKLDLDGNVKSVPVSEGHIKQVLINLFNNSEDAMPGGGLLFVKTSEVSGGVELVVEDEGLGIEPGKEEQLLRPFFTTKGVKGTGLGLSVSYGIVKSYGGELSLENREEGGVRARIFMPQAVEVIENAS